MLEKFKKKYSKNIKDYMEKNNNKNKALLKKSNAFFVVKIIKKLYENEKNLKKLT